MKHLSTAARGTGPDTGGNAPPAVTSPHPFLLPPPDAARALGVSERTLFSLTKRGDLPAVRIGRSVRYDPADLRVFVERAKGRGPH
ncbi:MAG TPA: helix-turn-helix domain-containing protein [Humisphaera sp.]